MAYSWASQKVPEMVAEMAMHLDLMMDQYWDYNLAPMMVLYLVLMMAY